MPSLVQFEPVDYLVIGNLSCDITPDGPRLGGTAAYAALTAMRLGLRVGIVTAWGGEIPLDVLDGIKVQTVSRSNSSTTFENIYTPDGRIQYIHHNAPDISPINIPDAWQHTPIVHIGPIAGEGKSLVNGYFRSSLVGLTPQGWLRKWDSTGRIGPGEWPEAREMLSLKPEQLC